MNEYKVSFSQRLLQYIDGLAKKFLEKSGLGNSKVHIFLMKSKAILKHIIRPNTLDNIDICVSEHCNLGCYSCNHFSQLAEPEFANLSNTERDLKRLAELSGANIAKIYLVGGEPLLNPELPEFMRIAREYFPKSKIEIVTNGLLLLAQKDIFWESVKKYNIIMSPTKYPGVNWEKIEERGNEFGYKFNYFDFSDSSEKTSRKFCLDLSGSQDEKKSFKRCPMAICTAAMQNGQLATCSFVFNMRHFNRYFNQNIPVTNEDSIDIFKAKNMQEIVDFINSPIPLCKYCKSMGEEIVGPWRKTEKSITEWT
ncbi:MAG: radical SAM protein [Elusimicrobiota bacterium]|nr:radical SAM protein [Elusimicrobiota bacterium]